MVITNAIIKGYGFEYTVGKPGTNKTTKGKSKSERSREQLAISSTALHLPNDFFCVLSFAGFYLTVGKRIYYAESSLSTVNKTPKQATTHQHKALPVAKAWLPFVGHYDHQE